MTASVGRRDAPYYFIYLGLPFIPLPPLPIPFPPGCGCARRIPRLHTITVYGGELQSLVGEIEKGTSSFTRFPLGGMRAHCVFDCYTQSCTCIEHITPRNLPYHLYLPSLIISSHLIPFFYWFGHISLLSLLILVHVQYFRHRRLPQALETRMVLTARPELSTPM